MNLADLSYLAAPDPAVTADGTLAALFERAASDHAGRTAVECRGERLSYSELDARANRLATRLRERGLGRGNRAAVLLPKSLELYVSILGILKAGASYVPLDPSYPAERVRFICEDAGAAVLVTSLDFLGTAAALPLPKLYWNEERAALERGPAETPADGPAPGDDAYVIYTSGSTGEPKGVPVTHGSAHHLVLAEQKLYQVVPEDRVLQGFSTAFDASVEELWAAWAHGAALVAGTPELMLAGPDLGPALARLGVTVLSTVPTLMSVLREPVPCVRLLILGGEALSAEHVRPWLSPERRVYNTYGPTEATVVATACEVSPGAKVTIGRPLANVTCCVLGEDGALLPRGAAGELVLGGPGVARGYLGREELTRERFIPNAHAALTGDASPRLYRTGDLARVDVEGALEYLGRIDGQVKVRGYRVEPGEIEAALLKSPGVRGAAAVLHGAEGRRALAAYVVMAPGAAFDERALLAALKASLPPYMVPACITAMDAFPTLASGKTDRKALPRPRAAAPEPEAAEPADVPGLVRARWRRLFGRDHVDDDDDFFTDLGGHSLAAAQFVSAMRLDARFSGLSMADLYAHPTVAALSAFLAARPAASALGGERFHPVPPWRHALSAAAQALLLYPIMGFFALQWLAPFMAYSFFAAYERPRWEALAASFGALCLVYPAMLGLGLAAKWLLLGRVREGDHPLWGGYYLRWLFVQRLLEAVPLHYLGGTPLLPAYLRLLGARVGKDVHMDAPLLAGMDLLSIGDGATVNADANVSCSAIEDGLLRLRRVGVGAGASVGVRSVVPLGSALEDGAVLDDLSCLPAGARVPAGTLWSGSPAAHRGPAPRPPAGDPPSAAWRSFEGAFYRVSFLLLPALAVLPAFPGIALMYELDYLSEGYVYLVLAPLVGLIFVALSVLQIVALKRLVLGRLEEGVHPIHGPFYLRKWFADKLLESSLDTLRPLYATLYLNPWLRALGVEVGARAEVSTASLILPDLLTIGEGSFIADGVGLGPAKVFGRWIVLKRTSVGARTFVGNGALVPVGARLGDDCLLGVQTVPPGDETPGGTSWLGSPPVNLPQRQKSRRQFEAERTYAPTPGLYAQRLAIEFFRVLLPPTAFVVVTLLMLSYSVQIEDAYGPLAAVLAFPALYIGLGVLACLATAVLKHAVVGRYRPDEQPLWSPFVWRTELVTAFCEDFTNEFFVSHLVGTAFLPWYLRLLGMKVGARACLWTTDFTEFDLVRLGDDVALNEDCTIQTHLFEDRVMKLSTVDIGSRVAVGSDTVVLYGTSLEDDVSVGDLSLVMKGERLGTGTRWAGAPVRPAGPFS